MSETRTLMLITATFGIIAILTGSWVDFNAYQGCTVWRDYKDQLEAVKAGVAVTPSINIATNMKQDPQDFWTYVRGLFGFALGSSTPANDATWGATKNAWQESDIGKAFAYLDSTMQYIFKLFGIMLQPCSGLGPQLFTVLMGPILVILIYILVKFGKSFIPTLGG